MYLKCLYVSLNNLNCRLKQRVLLLLPSQDGDKMQIVDGNKSQ